MSVRVEVFRRLLGSMRRGHLLDLATGHGKFAMIAQELGWRVTAVDVRTKRMPMTPGIEWIAADVRQFPINGDYDCVALLGLLYHLELSDQLKLLRRCAGTPTIVDTHISLSPDHEEAGYRGHYFDELAGRTVEQHKHSGTASWGNLTSFWPDEESLMRMLRDCGFVDVWPLQPRYQADRNFFFCL